MHDDRHALVVDPGDSAPVLAWLGQHPGVRLDLILVTHHHADHVGGVTALRTATGATVYGPAAEDIPQPARPLGDGDHVTALGIDFEALDVPGHTAGHIAFYAAQADGGPVLFCGDTLFSGGCGRLFEGTPAQMLASLDRLAALPGATRVCCAHEYTLSNLRFARAVDADNAALARYSAECEAKRASQLPTLPSSITVEVAINPFLRSRQPAVTAAVQRFDAAARDEVAVFAALREWKNQFK